MDTQSLRSIEQITQAFSNGVIPLEKAAEAVMKTLHRYCSSDDVVLPYMCWTMLGCADDLIAALIVPVLGYFTPPDDIISTLQELAEMYVICRDEMPGEITLYRRVNDASNNEVDTGYSYTSDYEVARRFAVGEYIANRRAIKSSSGTIYTVKVQMKYVIGTTNDRNEAEVMILPPAAGGQISVVKIDHVTA